MTEFLHDECEARIENHRDVRTDVETDLREQKQHADREHLACALHLSGLDEVPAREAQNRADHERITERQQHDETELLNTDEFGDGDDDERQNVNLPILDEVHD